MDAHDVIRRNVSKTIFVDMKIALASTQPITCNTNTCNLSGCVLKYPDYQYRLLTKDGKKNCTGCC